MSRPNLQSRLGVTFVSFALITAIGASGIWWLSLRQVNEEATVATSQSLSDVARTEIELKGRLMTGLLSEQLVNPLYFFDLYEMQQIIGPLLLQRQVAYVEVYDANGRLIHNGNPSVPEYGQPLAGPFAAESLSSNEVLAQWSESIVDISRPIILDGERLGGVRIGFTLAEAAERAAELETAYRRLTTEQVRLRVLQAIALLGLLIIVAIVGSRLVARRMSAPLSQMLHLTRKIKNGQFDELPQPDGGNRGELGELLDSFIEMAYSVKHNTQRIHFLAYHDSLSGLANRLQFREFLADALRRHSANPTLKISLLYLDMDDFKRFNDSMGHDHGDRLLIAFANRLSRTVERCCEESHTPEPDILVARVGGDEFTISVIADEADQVAHDIAQALLETFSEPFHISNLDSEIVCTTSIGITTCPDDGYTADVLIKNADMAMYQAKQDGKNRYREFQSNHATDSQRRLEIENGLRRAIREERFRVVYQPIVRVSDERIVGAEALVRADHELLKGIPPSIFVPIAERMGVIEDVGRLAFHHALGDAQTWLEHAEGFRLTVNLSARELANSELMHSLKEKVLESRLEPYQLTFELTEHSLIDAQPETLASLEALRKVGCSIWLDDFGTGFSSLSQLRRLPVDGVKIDRSFVSDILDEPGDLALTKSIISMAHSLNIQVIAEGVENKGQLALLRQHECDLAQGYFFGNPMSSVELIELVK